MSPTAVSTTRPPVSQSISWEEDSVVLVQSGEGHKGSRKGVTSHVPHLGTDIRTQCPPDRFDPRFREVGDPSLPH